MKMLYDNKLNDYICCGDDELISVVSVIARQDYCLELIFSNGNKKLFNARQLIDKSLYHSLKNISQFLSAKVEGGTVVWNDGELDIAPELLYENSESYVVDDNL